MSINKRIGINISFFGLLTILFICFKVFNVVNWSWWIVLLPLYGPVAIATIIVLILLCVVWAAGGKLEDIIDGIEFDN